MAKKTITLQEQNELNRLSEKLVLARAEVAKARITDPPGHPLKGADLKRLMDKEEVAARIVRRIREIEGQ
jgi:hypothetical protein